MERNDERFETPPRTSPHRNGWALSALKTILSDGRAVQFINAGGSDWLDDTQKASLCTIARTFVPDIVKKSRGKGGKKKGKKPRADDEEMADAENDEVGLEDELVAEDGEEVEQSLAGAAFAPILRLRRPLRLPTHLKPFMARDSVDSVQRFFNDSQQLQLDGDTTDPLAALVACYSWTKQVKSQCDLGPYRFAIAMILMHDIVQLCCPNIKGSRLGPQNRREIEQFIRPAKASLVAVMSAVNIVDPRKQEGVPTMAEIAEDMANCRSLGRKILEGFVTPFSTPGQPPSMGVLFFLGDVLNEKFLQHKMSLSGANFDQAIAHLTDIGLAEAVMLEDTDHFGLRLRAYMRGLFDRAHAGSQHKGSPPLPVPKGLMAPEFDYLDEKHAPSYSGHRRAKRLPWETASQFSASRGADEEEEDEEEHEDDDADGDDDDQDEDDGDVKMSEKVELGGGMVGDDHDPNDDDALIAELLKD